MGQYEKRFVADAFKEQFCLRSCYHNHDEPKKRGFFADVKSFLLVSEKLIEKFPLKFTYTGAISCFSPILMATSSKVGVSRTESLFQMLFEDGHISSKCC